MRKMRGITALIAVILSLNGTAAAASSDSGEALYEAAIHAMASLPVPPFIAYRLEGQSESPRPMRTQLQVDPGNHVWLVFSRGDSRTTWLVLHRSKDFSNAIADGTGASYFTPRSFFDPTWDGAYHALHDGIFFNLVQRAPKPMPTSATPAPEDCSIRTIATVSVTGIYRVHEVAATPHPVATQPSPPCKPEAQVPLDSRLRTLALVHVMGPAVYAVHDAGVVTCENGDPGRMLHFTARSEPEVHQLTDAIVDVRLMRFCMMRFTTPWGATLEQHYANVNGYWLQTDGIVSNNFPVSLPGWRFQHASDPRFPMSPFSDDTTYSAAFKWSYRITGIAFPSAVPDKYFVTENVSSK